MVSDGSDFKVNQLVNIFYSIEREVEKLISLEAKLGPLSGYHPAINDVISYLMQVCFVIAAMHATITDEIDVPIYPYFHR